MKRAEIFIFNRVIFLKNSIKFEYIIDNQKFYFYSRISEDVDLSGNEKYLISANIGLSYMVDLLIVTLPKTIEIRVLKLDEKALGFWKQVYFTGLLERLYDEKLPVDLHDSLWKVNSMIDIPPFSYKNGNKYLLSMSGGKESLTILNLFEKAKFKDFSLFFLHYKIKKEGQGYFENRVYRNLSKEIHSIKFQTNIEDLGHIMKLYECLDNSVLVIAQLIFSGLLLGNKYKGIVIGNEYSSNFGNAIYEGFEVNHQHDKTIAFAKIVNEYIHNFITPDFKYFSPFFGLYEYKIAQYFPENNAHLDIWTSCNNTNQKRNFCCECPKCAFTYMAVLSYTNKVFLSKYFAEDMLTKLEVCRSIMDFNLDKPLDCVGTKEEVWYSLYQIFHKNIDQDSVVIKYFMKNIYSKIAHRIGDIENELNAEHTNYEYIPSELRHIFDFQS